MEIIQKTCECLDLPLTAYLDTLLLFTFCDPHLKAHFTQKQTVATAVLLSAKINQLEDHYRTRDVLNAVNFATSQGSETHVA